MVRPRSTRRGFTMLEMLLVLAMISILAALGVGQIQGLISRMRTRDAARGFADSVHLARQLAILHNRETKVEIIDYDPDPEDGGPNYGHYQIAMGNKTSGSTKWDVLPYEGDAGDSAQGEGDIDLSEGAPQYHRGVSISIPSVSSIIFNPSGWIANPATEFETGGVITVSFANKVMIADGVEEYFHVRIFRGGMTRIDTTDLDIYGTNTTGTSKSSSDGTGSSG